MRALVTGAGGFIGHHVVRVLREEGADVRALLHPAESDALLGEEIPVATGGRSVGALDVVRGDVLDTDAVASALEGCDELYHLAAIYSIRPEDTHRIYRVNLLGTQIVLGEALRAKVARVVFTSSISAIGRREGADPARPESCSDESTPWNLEDEANAYIHSKWLSERAALELHRLGLNVVIVNPAFPFGPGDRGPTPTGRIVLSRLAMPVPIYFDGGFNAVDVRDVARWHVAAARKGRAGERYILGDRNISIRELYDRVGRIAGHSATRWRVPSRAAFGVAAAVTEYAKLTGGVPFTTVESYKTVSRGMYANAARTHTELGAPRWSIDTSLADAIAWWRAHGMLPGSEPAAATDVAQA